MSRYRSRRDANEPEIVAALRAAGATVKLLEPSSDGLPDLLVGLRGKNYLIEVKNPATRRGQQGTGSKTAQRQADFRARWNGRPVAVVETQDQALAAVGATTTAIVKKP